MDIYSQMSLYFVTNYYLSVFLFFKTHKSPERNNAVQYSILHRFEWKKQTCRVLYFVINYNLL